MADVQLGSRPEPSTSELPDLMIAAQTGGAGSDWRKLLQPKLLELLGIHVEVQAGEYNAGFGGELTLTFSSNINRIYYFNSAENRTITDIYTEVVESNTVLLTPSNVGNGTFIYKYIAIGLQV